MATNLKLIAYSFIAQEIQVYIPNEITDAIYINNLVCSTCGNIWHTSLLECYFCGSLNSYIYKCKNCGNYIPITNSKKECPSCNSKSLYKVCYNPDCISNTDEDIRELVYKNKGVFDRESSFNISLQNCYFCGGKMNEYKSYLIFVCPITLEVENFSDNYSLEVLKNFLDKKLEENQNYNEELVIFKIKNKNNNNIKYIFNKINYFYENNFEKPGIIYDSISNIANILYPIIENS